MLQTEFVRSLNSNYERFLLDKKPEENKYQYCILGRGGIKGLLPCSLRYINGLAYLYYDITSKQSVMQLYSARCITREWIKDFLWSLKQIRQELERFLLEDCNILWRPEQIFQELESNMFSYVYVPYYEEENDFIRLIEFWVEHIDYEDEILVEYIYKIYEQFELIGNAYLQEQIFEDAKVLDTAYKEPAEKTVESSELQGSEEEPVETPREVSLEQSSLSDQEQKKGFFHLLEGKKRKNKENREQYSEHMQQMMNGYSVAEEIVYGEECGKTIYIEEIPEEKEKIHRLYTTDEKILAQLDKPVFSIGKKRGEADLILEDLSVSRIHCRIIREGEDVYLEDMNSTNGTFKNGLRMLPYEKRKLEEEDEIKIGKQTLVYR